MALKTLNFSDKNLQLLQDNIAQALPSETTLVTVSTDVSGNKNTTRSSVQSLFSGGTLIKTALKSSTDNLVPHGLNRTPVVWVVMGVDSNASIWSPVNATLKNSNGVSLSADGTYLNLRCSSNCNVTVWVN